LEARVYCHILGGQGIPQSKYVMCTTQGKMLTSALLQEAQETLREALKRNVQPTNDIITAQRNIRWASRPFLPLENLCLIRYHHHCHAYYVLESSGNLLLSIISYPTSTNTAEGSEVKQTLWS
jgi:hypothetical protein